MIKAVYAADYHDRHGDFPTTIGNDGTILSMTVRDVEFRGTDFDALEPTHNADPAALRLFTLQHGCLCSCTIKTEIPVTVEVRGELAEAPLLVCLELGDVRPNGSIDREVLELEVALGGVIYRSQGKSGWFEDELLDLQRRLPEGVHLKTCFTCAFSDYSPAGHGLFSGLACFRDEKEAYLAVRSKSDLFRVWPTMSRFVQETYLCPEFRRRVPGTGYRG